MKKFRVEVDGEEFIVNVEEIGSEAGGEAVQSSTAGAGSSSAAQKSKPKKAAPKPKKQPQKEMAAPADIGEGDVVAPMPGSILEINVKKGETVSKGDNLIVLEAMKMENEITAAQAGTVKDIKVRVGDSVDAEDLLLVIE
ncbi:MAG: biotin/lipoyl-containing protein [Halanaerobium sp.]